MTSVIKLLDISNPVFRAYITYTAILVLKVLFMVVLTARQRIKHSVVHSKEDEVYLKGNKKTVPRHDDVERVRRAHRNDLENIPFFFVVSFAYVLTNPDPHTALNLFRIFTLARIAHTFVYAMVVLPQPARALSFFAGYLVTIYMAVRAIAHFGVF